MEKNILKRVASLALAVVMMLSVLVVVDPQEVSASEMSIKGSGTQTVKITDEDLYNEFAATGTLSDVFIQFKAAKTGYVTFKMTNNSSEVAYTNGYVTLCDKNKKAISSRDMFQDQDSGAAYNTVTYGVKKGTTYWLKVELYQLGTTIKADFKSQSKSSANSKKKAKNLGKNKEAKSIMIANENKADWYKIKLTKSQQLKLTFNVKTNGTSKYDGVKFSLYKSNGKTLFTSNAYDYISRYYSGKGTVTYYMSKKGSSKKYGIPKGTYYVKAERANKTSSGYYTLKWK
ncbi:MAG: hypothetical protein NC307_05200 [Roseburia sp.]|nr:hypothetical protein [Roseburia sp.]